MEPTGIGLIYIRHDFFDWISSIYLDHCRELLLEAAHHWFDQYPIGYTDVDVRYVIISDTLFSASKRVVAKLPEQLCPKRIHFWDVQTTSVPGKFRMAIEKLSDIPADRPLISAERKALFKELKDAKTRLVCA